MSNDAVNADLLNDLQGDLVGRLNADAYFYDVVIIAEQPGVTVNTIESAIAQGGIGGKGGKRGAVVVVYLPMFSAGSVDVPGPEGTVEVEIQAMHRPLFNDADKGGTGKRADAIAVTVANVLHHYRPEGIAGVRGNWMTRGKAVESLGSSKDAIGYRTRLEIPVTVGRTARVAKPVITIAASEVTMTTTTAGAVIFYTTDGSYPGRHNAQARLYSGGFAEPESPYVIRAAAQVEDGTKIGSQVAAVGG